MTPAPTPVNEYNKVQHALIAPNGDLYNVGHSGGHSDMQSELEDVGVLDVTSDRDYRGSVHMRYGIFDFVGVYPEHSKVTQAQFDTMTAYAEANDYDFDFKKLEVIDARPAKKVRARKANPFSEGAYAT